MADMVTVTINGREITAPAGSTILDAARDANIHIPSLCSNEELTPYGACRLCMVEIGSREKPKLVASCIYEVADGLEVRTETTRVNNVRRFVIELLLARNPDAPVLRKIADGLGVQDTRFKKQNKGCILCGQCVRTCREVVGVSAIGFKGRGVTRQVSTPFEESPVDCIACGSCSYICPVKVIPLKEGNGVREIWKTKFELKKCKKCGRYFAPVKQLEYFSKITKLPKEHFEVCLDCR